MNQNNATITLHMVASLDGFIGKPDGDLSWMQTNDHYEKGVALTAGEIEAFLKNIDCYVMGSRTYEHALALGWPYGDTHVVVLTSRKFTSDRATVQFYGGDLQQIVCEQLKPRYNNIWMVGGARLARDMIRLDLVDELVISLLPVILGDGILFFDYVGKERVLHLQDVKAYKDGMVELRYTIKKGGGVDHS